MVQSPRKIRGTDQSNGDHLCAFQEEVKRFSHDPLWMLSLLMSGDTRRGRWVENCVRGCDKYGDDVSSDQQFYKEKVFVVIMIRHH